MKDYSIVTGANSGIGREVAAGLMSRGHHVVLACRNMEACELVAQQLRAAHPQGACECSQIDLEDLHSVRSFAKRHRDELSRKGRKLRVLVNNAGIMGPPNLPNGEDRHLWANHLGPYLLTRLLLPSFAQKGRVVNVSSRAHYWGNVFVKARGEAGTAANTSSGSCSGGSSSGGRSTGGSGYSGCAWEFYNHPRHWLPQYARSKLCNVLFTHELQRRHASRPNAILTASVSPGLVGTSIFKQLPWPLNWVAGPLQLLARTPAQGAETAIWAATSEEVDGSGKDLFLHDCKPMKPSALALDEKLAAAVWKASALAVGLHPDQDDV